MRLRFRSFWLFSLMVLLPLITVQAGEAKTVVLDVPGMTCRFCPITVRKALQKVPGVVKAESDFESKTATVTFDPDKTTVEDLTRAVKNAGYDAIPRQGKATDNKPQTP